MPTSAAGSRVRCCPAAPARARIGGFTLLELLVVIAIIALATAGVGLSLRDSGQASLDREAERLAALLESARAQSRASGIAVRWRLTPDGPGNFSFDGLPPGSLPAHWLADGITAQPISADGRAAGALQLGPDPIIAAQQVVLSTDGPPNRSLRIGTDGLRPFAVVSP
ncbi:prepilin-type N-terminal cleavage/methylation domain-containing protein [Variovorax sp. M-6]|uniref:prepilin-type N-terminal cleavage/methylation domain-containing protein n=1 Tax=Variovorax sp. M-6 TaxID=3233041 RepID=UPI003F948AFC